VTPLAGNMTVYEKLDIELKRFKKDKRIKWLNERIANEYSKNWQRVWEIERHNRTCFGANYLPPFTTPIIDDSKRRIQHILKHHYYMIFEYKKYLKK